MGMRLREFAGAINRCHEVLVAVHYGPGEEDFLWLPIAKTYAREITDKAREANLEEIDAVLDGDDLYIDAGDEEGAEEEEEEEELPPPKEEAH